MNLKNLIDEFLKYCLYNKNLNQKTLKAYKIDLNQYINISNEKLDKDSIKKYIEYLNKNYKPKSIRRKIASLKTFTSFLLDNDFIKYNPFNKIKINLKQPLILPRTISFNLIELILKEPYLMLKEVKTDSQTKIIYRDIALLEILFATGARVSEISTLRVNDVDLDNHYIRLYGKGAKERIINIENEEVLNALRKYTSCNIMDVDKNLPFFKNRLNKSLSDQSIRAIVKKYSSMVCDYHITPHMFRHTFATLLLEEDVDIRFIQRMLGHSSIATTQIYTYVSINKQKEILSLKHPRNKMSIK